MRRTASRLGLGRTTRALGACTTGAITPGPDAGGDAEPPGGDRLPGGSKLSDQVIRYAARSVSPDTRRSSSAHIAAVIAALASVAPPIGAAR